MVFGAGNTMLKGAFAGAIFGIATGFLEGALAAAYAFLLQYRKARTQLPLELQHELHQLVELALDRPHLLLTGRPAQRLRRLLECFSPGELPWQLVLIHQRLELAIDVMPYEQRYALFGGNAPPAPASEELLRQLPRTKLSKQQAARRRMPGGQALDARCAICLQDWVAGDVACMLPGCLHGFHHACVSKWLRKSSTCPTCRHEITTAKE